MFKRFLIFALLLAVSISGCAASRNFSGASGESMPGVAPAPAYEMDATGSKSVTGGDGGNFTVAQTSAERMVIKNATLSLYVDDPDISAERIGQMAEGMGGFVVSKNVYQSRLQSGLEVPHASITVRVPAEQLDDAMSQIKSETTLPLINENVSSQDVTSEYTDLSSQLRNLEAAEEQLQQIMDEAKRTEDVISVYRELTNVRGQIEIIKGQMKYYEQSAALSAISVELTASAAQQPITVAGWQPKGVARDAVQALVYAIQALGSMTIWLVLFLLPIGLLIALVIYLAVLVIRTIVRRVRHAK